MISAVSIWMPLIYQYGVGGVVFLIGLTLVLRSQACDIRRRSDRFWLFVVVGGMALYFGVHLAVYLLALYVLPHGGRGVG